MSNLTVKGNASGTGTVILEAPNTNSNRTITLPDAATTLVGTDATQTLTNKTLSGSTIQGGALTLGTAVASTSGTSIDFTGIPSWAKRVTVMLSGVSFASAAGTVRFQMGDAGGIEEAGYNVNSMATSGASASVTNIANVDFVAVPIGAFNLTTDGTSTYSGSIVINNITGNTWVIQGFISTNGTGACSTVFGGVKTLSATLDRVRITSQLTPAFDAGTINIMWEG